MFFLNFSSEVADSLKSKYREVAEQYKGQGLSFLMGDIESSQAALNVCIPFCFVWLFMLLALFSISLTCLIPYWFALQYFGLNEDQVPVILVQKNDRHKFVKSNVEPDQIAPWMKEYKVKLFLLRYMK